MKLNLKTKTECKYDKKTGQIKSIKHTTYKPRKKYMIQLKNEPDIFYAKGEFLSSTGEGFMTKKEAEQLIKELEKETGIKGLLKAVKVI